MKAKPLTDDQKELIISLYDKYSCVEISKIVGVTINQVYDLRKRLNLTQKQNPQFIFNEIQNQLLLGGKLGDGNFKSNGSLGCYYRENHAEDELEYLTWKANTFGEEILSSKGVHKIKLRPLEIRKPNEYTIQQPYVFSTKTSSSFNKYKDMTIKETILNLNYKGLIIFMLDDGWFSTHNKKGNFLISGGILSDDEMNLLCEQFEKYDIKNAHIIGKKRKDITIPNENNSKLYEMTTSFIPKSIDIINKKFKTMI